MSAKGVLVAKPNSHPFDDRALILDIPTKIGRSHRDDQADSANGFFDCKVLSRQHAILLYEDDKFYLMDTGSSNGSFVNNIRLSKSGEESKLTRIYSNDVLRFGSDVVDKQKQITQKCVVMKVKLYYPDALEVESRPSESRLFRPNDSMEDLSALTQSLQETLTREKNLEDKMIRIRGMISKNIGKTHTDLLRLFENIKQELMNNEQNFSTGVNTELEAYQKIMSENVELHKRLADVDKRLRTAQGTNDAYAKQQDADQRDIGNLSTACQIQKQTIEQTEKTLQDLQDELHHNRLEADEKYNTKLTEMDKSSKEVMEHYEEQLLKQEELFFEERTTMREQLTDIRRSEKKLLDRINCLESEEKYSHAEVEKVLLREREAHEERQRLEMEVDQLKQELDQADRDLESEKSKIKVQRSEEDLEKIAELETSLGKLKQEIGYLKQELLEARARKSASDDNLRTTKDKLETLEISMESLTTEGIRHRKQISDLREALEAKTQEALHLGKLVHEMEASHTFDEMTKVQIHDLRQELHNAEGTSKARQENILELRQELKGRDEEIQELEIELSRLRGQVDNVNEELRITKEETSYVADIKDERDSFRQKYEDLHDEFNYVQDQANHLTDELTKQQTLYSELKKMRGRGEEIDQLQQCREDLKAYQQRTENLETMGREQQQKLLSLERERTRMASEVTETRRLLSNNPHLSPTEAAMQTVGNLRLYELVLGLVFILLILTFGLF